jgi:hypothetical protein
VLKDATPEDQYVFNTLIENYPVERATRVLPIKPISVAISVVSTADRRKSTGGFAQALRASPIANGLGLPALRRLRS